MYIILKLSYWRLSRGRTALRLLAIQAKKTTPLVLGSSLSISTSQSKFGSSSLFHDNQSSTTDHVSLGTSSDFLINQNTEYTFEFWYRALDTTTPTVFIFWNIQ